jgi:glycosyltransferase involved in cell wall biosynthesis
MSSAVAEPLSVVVPVHNEQATIAALVHDLERELVPACPQLEVIVVDDASSDETPVILSELGATRPWLQVHRLEPNVGHGPAVRHGLDRARGEWIFQLDSDGQFRVDEFPLLWERRHDGDLLLGVRLERHDPRHRLLLSRVVAGAASALAARRMQDANTPFRLIRREAWDDVRPLVDPSALAPNILIAVGAIVRGWRIVEVPVTHLPREGGASTLRALRLLRFSLRGLFQLLAFRRGVRARR